MFFKVFVVVVHGILLSVCVADVRRLSYLPNSPDNKNSDVTTFNTVIQFNLYLMQPLSNVMLTVQSSEF